MTWVRLDEDFAHHPKVVDVGPIAMAMHVAALCYCNTYLTDGLIPYGVIESLIRVEGMYVTEWDVSADRQLPKEVTTGWLLRQLLNVGLWEDTGRGWQIHDFNEYQPTREQVLTEREKAAERKRKSRGMSRRDNGGTPNGSHTPPVPVPEEEKESSNELSSQVREVYEHWRVARTKTRSTYAKIHPSRASIIKARLRDGYTVAQCKQAIDAVARDDWDGRGKFDDVKYILGPSKIDGWLDYEGKSSGPVTVGHPDYHPTSPGDRDLHERLLRRHA